MQQTFRTKTLITKGGKISIKGLPFHTGESVEVIVRRGKKSVRAGKYSLHGKPMTYRDPFKGVVGEGDYLVIREQLFAKETVKSLYKQIEEFQKKKGKK